MVQAFAFSTRDSTRPTSRSSFSLSCTVISENAPQLFPTWLRGVSAHPPTHPPTHARTPTHGRRSPLSLSLSSLTAGTGAEAAGASEAHTLPRMLGRGGRSRCGYPSPTCLDTGSSRSYFCWPIGVRAVAATAETIRGLLWRPARRRRAAFPPWRCRKSANWDFFKKTLPVRLTQARGRPSRLQ